MARFNLFSELQIGGMPTEAVFFKSPEGFMIGWGSGDPPASDGFAPGALFLRTDNQTLIQNTGTKAAPTWTAR